MKLFEGIGSLINKYSSHVLILVLALFLLNITCNMRRNNLLLEEHAREVASNNLVKDSLFVEFAKLTDATTFLLETVQRQNEEIDSLRKEKKIADDRLRVARGTIDRLTGKVFSDSVRLDTLSYYVVCDSLASQTILLSTELDNQIKITEDLITAYVEVVENKDSIIKNERAKFNIAVKTIDLQNLSNSEMQKSLDLYKQKNKNTKKLIPLAAVAGLVAGILIAK